MNSKLLLLSVSPEPVFSITPDDGEEGVPGVPGGPGGPERPV